MTSTLKKRNASMPTFKQTGKQISWPVESLQQQLSQGNSMSDKFKLD
jgi:hypothetical protein